jgi:hypothetical protein
MQQNDGAAGPHISENEDTVELVRPRREVEFHTPPNRLKRMASVPGGKSMSDMVAASNSVVEEMSAEFIDQSADDISNLRRMLKEMSETLTNPEKTTDEIYAIGAQLTGVAGTFNYPLVTSMGTSLIDFVLGMIESGANINSDPRYSQVIELHLSSMELVLAQKLKGPGGLAEFEMVAGLHKAVEMLSA